MPPNEPRPVPGSYGLPIVGRVIGILDFMLLSGWRQFFVRRQKKYQSNVFRTHLFQPTTAILDHEGIAALFQSEPFVQDYGFSWAVPPLPLVGHEVPSIFETGPTHDRPKALYMRLLKQSEPKLIPTFDAVSGEFVERWLALNEFSWRDELEDFAVSLLFQWLLGSRPPPRDVREIYNNIFTHLFVGIKQHIPWSRYARSIPLYQRLVNFVRESPQFPAILKIAHEEGLTEDDGVAKQITFLLGMNAYLGTQCFMKSLVGELSFRQELRQSLRTEMESALGPSRKVSDLAVFTRMPLLDRVLREVLRLHPPVFFVFGRSNRDVLLTSKSGTFLIRKGELVMGVIPMAHHDEAVFPNSARFDPDRFADPSSSAHLIWPRGSHDATVIPQDRICPGKDVAIIVGKLLCATLLLRVEWELKGPPRWGNRWFHLNVAAPIGPLNTKRFVHIS